MPHAQTKTCAQDKCTAETKTDRWNSIRAHDQGWFFQKDGTVWCPDHTPDWVAGWRQERGIAVPKPNTTVMLADCTMCGIKIKKPFGEGQAWVHIETEEAECDA